MTKYKDQIFNKQTFWFEGECKNIMKFDYNKCQSYIEIILLLK